jgi:hypothetical protein
LKRWQEDGTFEHLQSRILAIADHQGLINWNYGAIDGSFSRRIGRRGGGCLWSKGKRDFNSYIDRRRWNASEQLYHCC